MLLYWILYGLIWLANWVLGNVAQFAFDTFGVRFGLASVLPMGTDSWLMQGFGYIHYLIQLFPPLGYVYNAFSIYLVYKVVMFVLIRVIRLIR